MAQTPGGSQWTGLVELDEAARQRGMREQLDSVLALEGEARDQALEEMVTAEYGLDEPALKTFTASRLRVWAEIAGADLSSAQQIARGYDAVFDRSPAAMAMRRASVVQTVARTELSPTEIETLFQVIPSMLRQVPRATTDTLTGKPAASKAPAQVGQHGRPWWKVWSRGATA